MTGGRCRTWFETLRRDRGLFAFVGCFLLLLNIVQPLAAGQASEGGHWVICTVFGGEKPIETSDLPAVGLDNCPICLSGNVCPSAPAYKAPLAVDPAFPAPEALPAPFMPVGDILLPAPRAVDPPSAIRAPPLSV